MSGYVLRYHSRSRFEDAIRTNELDQHERFQHTERLRRERIEFVAFVLQLQQPSQNDVIQMLPPIVEARGLRAWNRLVQVADALSVLDYWMSRLDDNDSSCCLILHFMPQRSCAGFRKMLSWDGAVVANPMDNYMGVDLGNGVYGTFLHCLCGFFGRNELRYRTLVQLNDETLGDILGAIMGLWYHTQKEAIYLFDRGPAIASLRPSLVAYDMLKGYVFVLEHALHFTKQVINIFTAGGVWATSRELALFLRWLVHFYSLHRMWLHSMSDFAHSCVQVDLVCSTCFVNFVIACTVFIECRAISNRDVPFVVA